MTENTIQTVKISRIINECEGVKTIIFNNKTLSSPKPGQFVMIWMPGVDEVPMSISVYDGNGSWAITVKSIGECTQALHKLAIDEYIGVRGPLGNHFKIPSDKKKQIFLVGGGIGMAPLRYLANELKKSGQTFNIIQGAKIERDLLYMEEFYEHDRGDSEFNYCTDDGSYGEKGSAVELFEKHIKDYRQKDFNNIIVYSCGPESMLYKLSQICDDHNIEFYASLERIMRCGCGLCGLCVLDPVGLLVCKDGPIFGLDDLKKIQDFGNYQRDFTGKKIHLE